MKRAVLSLIAAVTLLTITSRAADPPHQDAPAPELTVPQVDDGRFLVQHADVPLYPAIAKTAHMSGTVILRVTVKAGAVVAVEDKSSGAPLMLVKAATENVKTWQFFPDSQSTRSQGMFDVTYVYELEKNESEFAQNPRIELRLPTFVKIVAAPPKPTVTNGVSAGSN